MNAQNLPAACLRDVGVRFGDARILSDVNLTVPGSGVTAIVGESGSGKSTLLRLLNGLVPATAGAVEVLGQSMREADVVGLRRRIGYAVQDVGLFPHLRVLANILLPLEIAAGDPEAGRARAGRLMELMGLDTGIAKRYPHELSGGQQQRVGICRAMICEPPLLLLDESFSGVDALTRIEIHERFADLQAAEGTAVVLVTHDVHEAVRLASHLVVLRDGRIVAQGTPAELRARPSGDYARRLLNPVAP
jgi:osmoprotectant transport system ATP-binding protein